MRSDRSTETLVSATRSRSAACAAAGAADGSGSRPDRDSPCSAWYVRQRSRGHDLSPAVSDADHRSRATGPRRYRLGSMAVQAWFVQEDTTVRPGDLGVVVGRRSRTSATAPRATRSSRPGCRPAWTTVTRPNVTLFGGSRDVDRGHRPPAGDPVDHVRARPRWRCGCIPQGDPDESTVAETIIMVGAFDDRRITMLQPLPAWPAAGDLRVHGRQPRQQPRQLPAAPRRRQRPRRRVVRPAGGRRRARIEQPRAAQAALPAQLLPARRAAGRLRGRGHRARARARHRAGDADPAVDDPAAHDRPRRAGVGRHGASSSARGIGVVRPEIARCRRPCRRRPGRRARRPTESTIVATTTTTTLPDRGRRSSRARARSSASRSPTASPSTSASPRSAASRCRCRPIRAS